MQVNRLVLFLTYSYFIYSVQCLLQPFIVDGVNAEIEDFSYSALLFFRCVKNDSSDDKYVCGASIVNQVLTLTAGHCIYECSEKSRIQVYVGHEGMYSGNSFDIHSFIHHDDFEPHTLSNDIGLVRLMTTLELNTKIGRVALMPDPPYNEEAIVAGWGMHDEVYEDYPSMLQYTTQNVMSKDECQKEFQEYVIEGIFCATGKKGHPSRGDSGSPLVVKGYIQIGIVSFRLINATNENQTVVIYTDTGHFYKWIDNNAHFITCAS